MFISLLIINLLCFIILCFSVGVISAKNSIYSICNLIIVFLLCSFYLIIWGIYYIAFTYLVIYIGAIATIFLFVIIILNINNNLSINKYSIYNKYLLLALFFSFFFLIFFIYFLPSLNLIDNIYNFIITNIYYFYYILRVDFIFRDLSDIQTIGIGLYTYNISILIIVGLILLLSIVGVILLTIKSPAQNKSEL